MKKYLALSIFFLLIGAYIPASAQVIEYVGGALERGVTTGLREMVGNNMLRNVYALSRQSIRLVDFDIERSLVQLKLPKHQETLGTGGLIEYLGQVYVAVPYHIGGRVGSMREIMFDDGRSWVGKVAFSGNAGFHSPDLSLFIPPKEMLVGKTPLKVGELDVTKPVYTFGYTVGRFGMGDYFATQRKILGTEGMGIMGDRIVLGETPGHVLNLSGACGSLLVQKGEGGYFVGGIHAGSVIKSTTNLEENLTFAVNLPKALNAVVKHTEKSPQEMIRPLQFKGMMVDNLAYEERVKTIELVRNGEVMSSKEIRNLPSLYSDIRSEKALTDQFIVSGDLLRYHIQGPKHKMRIVEYRVP